MFSKLQLRHQEYNSPWPWRFKEHNSVINATFLDFKRVLTVTSLSHVKSNNRWGNRALSLSVRQPRLDFCVCVCVCPLLDGPSSVFVLVSFQWCWCFWTPLCDIICKKLNLLSVFLSHLSTTRPPLCSVSVKWSLLKCGRSGEVHMWLYGLRAQDPGKQTTTKYWKMKWVLCWHRSIKRKTNKQK